MSVLIKGMKKPKDCYQCRLHYGNGECGVSVDGNCPIIEIPDHGDLIDRDALRNEMRLSESCSRCERDAYRCQYYEEMTVMDVCERIDDAPVVIQAERSEE